MILLLFGFFALVSLVMVIIGLTRPTESAQAIIGFFLMFLLSIVIINGNLEYSTGETTTTDYTYIGATNQINRTTEINTISYTSFNDATSKRLGYYLALSSAVGMIGVIFSIRKLKKYEEDDE